MQRPDLLSSYEQQLVDSHRAGIKQAQQERTSALQGDLRKELESVYQEFAALEHDFDSPPFADALMHLYRLLY